MKTFGAWLRTQTHRDDPVGDLARDYTADCSCAVCSTRPRRRYSVDGIRGELDDHGAIDEAYEAFDRAVAEWRTHEVAAADQP